MLYFLEGRFAEVTHFQQFFVGANDQIADGGDAFRFQAVGGPDGQFQLGQAHVELAFQFVIDRVANHGRIGLSSSAISGPGSAYWMNGFRCLRRILAPSTRAICGVTVPLVQISMMSLS